MTQEEMWLLDEKHGGEKTDAFIDDCARLRAGEPLAYIIGYIPFRSTIIHLDSRPLIPRTESEFWIGEIIEDVRKRAAQSSTPLKVLDLCAGSGALGIAILDEVENTRVDFAEIEEAHHPTIQRSILANKISPDRTRIYGGDLFERVEGPYDYIITNPPYIDPALDRTQASVKFFEPSVALYGGVRGMEIIERIIIGAPKHLAQRGTLIIEHEPEQSAEIQRPAVQNGFSAVTHTDQYDMERYTILTRKAV